MLLLLVWSAGCSFDSAPLGLTNGGAQHPVRAGSQSPQAGQPATAGSSAIDDGTSGGGASGGGGAIDAGASDSGAQPSSTDPPSSNPTHQDASPPPPPDPPDAGSVPPDDSAIADAAADSGKEPVEPPPVEPEPPTKGLLFDRCVTDHGCSLGLVCYGAGPGHCAQPCSETSDCVAVDGFEFTCSTNDGACRIDCSDKGPRNACPKGLTCVDRGNGERRCMLPREQGSGDRELFEACDRAHGDDDCIEGLVCYRSDDSQIDGPGYCTAECGDRASACDDLPASSAQLECAGDVCRFDCSEAACPLGMACEQIGERGVCHRPSL